jgi:hypothetical protein
MLYIENYDIDLDQFAGFARALYLTDGDNVRRYAMWGEDTEPAEIPDEVRLEMTAFSDQGVVTDAESSAATKDRLRDLGYL